MDFALGGGTTFLWNPSVFSVHIGTPEGFTPTAFVGTSQGVGLRLGTGRVAFTPTAAVVWGRVKREPGNSRSPQSHAFGLLGLGIALRPDPKEKRD
jgi:hypothetical protein